MYQSRPAVLTSFWRSLNRSIGTLLVLQLLSGMILAPHMTFFPLYLNDLGYSPLLIANLAAAKQTAGLVSSLLGGTLSDWLGRKRTLLLGIFGLLLSSNAFISRSLAWIGILWVLGGLGSGLHTLGGQSYLIDAAAPAYLGLTSALYNWGYTLGGVLSSPIAGALLDRWNYQVFGKALVVFSLLALGTTQFILPRVRSVRRASRLDFKHFFGYQEIATRPSVHLLVALRFLPTLAYAMMLLLVPLLLDAAGANHTTIAWYATTSWLAASLAQALVGWAADRWGPKLATSLAFSTLLAGVVGLGFGHAGLWAVFLFGTLGIAAAWSLSTLLPSLVALATLPEDRGRVLGFIHLGWNLAMISGSLVGGAFFQVWAGLPFLFAALVIGIALYLLLIFFRRVACSPSDEIKSQ